ncbi:MAG: hypothetical protein FIB07_17010 [Candidatus Methanoperedens sp.]|nr:hypothetical protein [Candidatus Methanoperedens sp.]
MCWICGHDLSQNQHNSMVEFNKRTIRAQHQEILHLKQVIEDQMNEMQIMKEKHTSEISELHETIDELETRLARTIRRSIS